MSGANMGGSNQLARRHKGLLLFSPGVAVTFSLLVATGSVLLPAPLYRHYVSEPDRMFLRADVLGFVYSCALAFLVGLWLGRLIEACSRRRETPAPRASWTSRATVVVVVAGAPLVLMSVHLLFNVFRSVSFKTLLLTLSLEESASPLGQGVLSLLHAGGYWVPLSSLVLIWVGLWVLLQAGRSLGRARWVLGSVVVTLVVTQVAIDVLSLKRGPLLFFGLSLIMLWALHAHMTGRLTLARVARMTAPFGLAGLAYFGVTQIAKSPARYLTGHRGLTGSVVGYYAGSYNRLAELMDGRLALGSPGGYYWTRWIWEFSVTNEVLHLDRAAKRVFPVEPPSDATRRTEYIRAAGLDRSYTSITAFGMSYVDFRWLGLIPFLPYGILTAILWKLFQRGALAGILLYPTIFWSVLEWRGYLEVSRESLLGIIIFGTLVWLATKMQVLPMHPPKSET